MFEYYVLRPAPRWNRDTAAEIAEALNRLGSEGWELVCNSGVELFVFKRGKAKSKGPTGT